MKGLKLLIKKKRTLQMLNIVSLKTCKPMTGTVILCVSALTAK